MDSFKTVDGVRFKVVYSRYIRKNGKRVYPKRSKVFRFLVKA